MKQIEVKPGTIFLGKEYKWYEKIWSFITRKKLDYNKFYVFDETMSMIGNPKTSRLVLLEPRKKYSNKEVTKLRLLNRLGWIDRAEDVLATINTIRPNTVDSNKGLDQLLTNRFYNIRHLSDEKEYIEYIPATK